MILPLIHPIVAVQYGYYLKIRSPWFNATDKPHPWEAPEPGSKRGDR